MRKIRRILSLSLALIISALLLSSCGEYRIFSVTLDASKNINMRFIAPDKCVAEREGDEWSFTIGEKKVMIFLAKVNDENFQSAFEILAAHYGFSEESVETDEVLEGHVVVSPVNGVAYFAVLDQEVGVYAVAEVDTGRITFESVKEMAKSVQFKK